MSSINNISELKLEIQRLKGQKVQKEYVLQNDWIEIQDSLQSVNKIINSMGSFFSPQEHKKSLLIQGVEMGINLFTNAYLGNSAGPVKRVFGFLLKRLTSTIIAQKSDSSRK